MPSESNPPYPLPGRPFDLPKPEAPYRPAYFKNTIPSYWRRDKNHDYTRRCIYMLTMRKAPDMPDFSNVFAPDGNPFKPQISLSRLGAIIYHEIHSLSVSFPSVKVFDSVVMPDHIHFVVYLSESGMHPGDIVKKFKGLCSRAWQRLQRPLRTSATLLRPLHARPLPHHRRRDLPHLGDRRHPRAQQRHECRGGAHRLRRCHPEEASLACIYSYPNFSLDPLSRNRDDGDRRFAYRCMMQAHKMLRPSAPRRGMRGSW